MAIYVVDGKPRHGKTAWVVSMVPDMIKEAFFTGYKVFSNVYIKVENIPFLYYYYENPKDCIGDITSKKDRENPRKLIFFWRNIHEWNFMDKGTIICDEATRYFNTRRWALLSEDTEIKLQQHGKEQLDIYAITQSYDRLDISLRVITEKFFRVARVFGYGNRTIRAQITEHYYEDLEKYARNPVQYEKDLNNEEEEKYLPPINKRYFWIGKRVWNLYDTTEQVLASKPMPLKHIERKCHKIGCKKHKMPQITHV